VPTTDTERLTLADLPEQILEELIERLLDSIRLDFYSIVWLLKYDARKKADRTASLQVRDES
jgi:hypothetical protein